MNQRPRILIIAIFLAGCYTHLLPAKSYVLNIEIPQSVESIKISDPNIYLESQWIGPDLNIPPLSPSLWKHINRILGI